MICPLYDKDKPAAHGLRCSSPVCQPFCDCAGSITNKQCTVPAFLWRKLVEPGLKGLIWTPEKEDLNNSNPWKS